MRKAVGIRRSQGTQIFKILKWTQEILYSRRAQNH
jgi:hypothetical protein